MGKRKKRLYSKRRILIDGKPTKQMTLDSLPAEPQKKQLETKESLPSVNAETPAAQKKQISIMKIGTTIKEDDLAIDIEYKLSPHKSVFSKIRRDLWFDGEKIDSVLIDIRNSFGSINEFHSNPVLGLQGISPGSHSVKVEMYEPSASGEKHSYSTMEATINYVPQTRESRLIKIPIVKKIEGEGIAVVSDLEKNIYRELEETEKKELVSNRDEW